MEAGDEEEEIALAAAKLVRLVVLMVVLLVSWLQVFSDLHVSINS